eukprot:SAG11_NODE_1874_length_4143_cov_10.521761_4_plen_309_part_00
MKSHTGCCDAARSDPLTKNLMKQRLQTTDYSSVHERERSWHRDLEGHWSRLEKDAPRLQPYVGDPYQTMQTLTDGLRKIEPAARPSPTYGSPLPRLPASGATPLQSQMSKLIAQTAHPRNIRPAGRGNKGATFASSSGPARPQPLTKRAFHRRAYDRETKTVQEPDQDTMAMLDAMTRVRGMQISPEFSRVHSDEGRRRSSKSEQLDPPSMPTWRRAGTHPPIDEGDRRTQRLWQRLVRNEKTTLLTIARLALPAGALFDMASERSVVLRRGVGRSAPCLAPKTNRSHGMPPCHHSSFRLVIGNWLGN